jgi:hypothetical protein
MITPKEIKQKAINKYPAFLEAYLEGTDFFPLNIPSDKKPSSIYQSFLIEISQIVDESKEKKGFGYVIDWKEVSTQRFGNQFLPSLIKFEDEANYLRFINKEKEFQLFKTNIKNILASLPQLTTWVRHRIPWIIKYTYQWEDILKVCYYFLNNPYPNLYIRELPINVHTKFIEENQGVLRELLDNLIPEYVNKEETVFEKRFNLKYNEPLIRLLILDPSLAETNFSGVADLSIKQSDFEKLNLAVDTVIILENKTNFNNIFNFLTLPRLKNSLAIFGKGFGLGSLKNSLWLEKVKIYYWGDIDAQGFQILSQLRSYFPQVKSLMMDFETLKEFNDECVTGTLTNVNFMDSLTEPETFVFQHVKTNNIRLEQEKISHQYVKEYFRKNFL